MHTKPVLYIQDPRHKMERVFLAPEVHAEAILAFPIVSTDVFIVDKRKRTIYLAKRIVDPLPEPFGMGGRSFAGEDPDSSIVRSFGRETGLILPPDRFHFVCMNRYFWATRKQEPKNAGVDYLAYTYWVELNQDELAQAATGLERGEYEPGSFKEYSWQDLVDAQIHPAVLSFYRKLFS